jgi:hypothetical protein
LTSIKDRDIIFLKNAMIDDIHEWWRGHHYFIIQLPTQYAIVREYAMSDLFAA